MANFEIDSISSDDIVIALMGATGSGKSQFINTATKTNRMGVGHTLKSHTSSIQTIRVPLPNDSRNRSVVFVDTPSFNNTAAKDMDGEADGEMSDEKVLAMLAEWLGRSYKNKIKLSGIIYTHRITDNRMAGSPLRNLHLFEQLVGVDAIPNVVLATTMWSSNPSSAQQSLSESRESQLVQKYWKSMLDQGSRTMRYYGSYDSAWGIVNGFLENSTPRKLLLQRELIDEKKPLHQTKAGMALQDIRWIVSDYRSPEKHHRRLRVFERMLAVSV